MVDLLHDIEVLEKSLELDDFGRQMIIWDMIQKKKKIVSMCLQNYLKRKIL